jgi:hypothetical protein
VISTGFTEFVRGCALGSEAYLITTYHLTGIKIIDCNGAKEDGDEKS